MAVTWRLANYCLAGVNTGRSMGQSVPPCKTPKRPCAIQAHLRVKAYCVANSEASSAASADSARPHRLHSKSLNSELPF